MSSYGLRRSRILPGALAAIAALGMSAATPIPRASTDVQPTKEYVQPRKDQREKKKKQTQGGGGKNRNRWTWDRRGNAIDGVGNYRSAKRLRREVVMRLAHKPNTGRQWKRVRRALRHHAPHVLRAHPVDLRNFAKARGL